MPTQKNVSIYSTHSRVAAALPASTRGKSLHIFQNRIHTSTVTSHARAAGCLRDMFVSALTVPSANTTFKVSTEFPSHFIAGTSAASGLSLLVITCGIIDGATADDAFTMFCGFAADAAGSGDVGVGGDDDEVPLHLHACRVVALCVGSSSGSREQFEVLCKSRVIPSTSAQLCAALKSSSSSSHADDASAACDDADVDMDASNSGSHQLPPSIACITALCRCSSLVPAVVAAFMPVLLQHLQVIVMVIVMVMMMVIVIAMVKNGAGKFYFVCHLCDTQCTSNSSCVRKLVYLLSPSCSCPATNVFKASSTTILVPSSSPSSCATHAMNSSVSSKSAVGRNRKSREYT